MKYLLLAPVLFAISAHAESNDTYNFYFQKAPGPVTVNQGALPQPGVSNTVVAPNATPAAVSVAAAPAIETSSRPRFFLSLGMAFAGGHAQADQFSVYSGKEKEYKTGQYMVKAEYELNEYIAITGEVHKLQRSGSYENMYSYTDNGYINSPRGRPSETVPEIPNSVIDYAAGAAVNVVRLRAATVSAIGGYTTIPYVQYETLGSAGSNSHYSAVMKGIQHQKAFYAGARARLIADNTWGVEGSYRQLIGAKQAIAEALLTFAL